MSEASEEAIAKAVRDVKKMAGRIRNSDDAKESLEATILAARELRLIRGELQAIRILLTEQSADAAAWLKDTSIPQ